MLRWPFSEEGAAESMWHSCNRACGWQVSGQPSVDHQGRMDRNDHRYRPAIRAPSAYHREEVLVVRGEPGGVLAVSVASRQNRRRKPSVSSM
jgi:hypothetical protein